MTVLSLSLRDADLPLLREALEDAIEEREPAGSCGRCTLAYPCDDHVEDFHRATMYRELLERIGDET